MPYRDGSGPTGQGPRSGRGAGNCAGTGSEGRFGGRGFGRRGAGRGFGNGLGLSADRERSWLENQIQSLRSALQNMSDRLDALKKE